MLACRGKHIERDDRLEELADCGCAGEAFDDGDDIEQGVAENDCVTGAPLRECTTCAQIDDSYVVIAKPISNPLSVKRAP